MDKEYSIYLNGITLVDSNLSEQDAVQKARQYEALGLQVLVEDAWDCEPLHWNALWYLVRSSWRKGRGFYSKY